MQVITGEFIFTTSGARVVLAVDDDGTVRVVLASTGRFGDSADFNLAPGDAHELGTKLRLAAKKADQIASR